jgi:signal transduction histidine kinase
MLCRHFAQLMGGEVEVTSAPTKGSTFTVCIPLAAPTPAAGPDATAPQ